MSSWGWNTGGNTNTNNAGNSGFSSNNNTFNSNPFQNQANNNGNNNQNPFGNQSGMNGNQNNNPNHQAQFVTRETQFDSLPDLKKAAFDTADKTLMQGTDNFIREVSGTIKRLEQLPDISQALDMYFDQSRLLRHKLISYENELDPFTRQLKQEFACASQVQVNLQSESHNGRPQPLASHDLPPKQYWHKIEQFEQQLATLNKQMHNLMQYLRDCKSKQQQTEVINTKNVTNTVKTSYVSTLKIGAQVVANHNMIQKLKQEYKKFRLETFGDSHDPFPKVAIGMDGSSAGTIEQFVSKAIQWKGLQDINMNAPPMNANQNQQASNGMLGGGNTTTNPNANAGGNTGSNQQSGNSGFVWKTNTSGAASNATAWN